MNRRNRLRGRGRFAAVRRSEAAARKGPIGARALCNGLTPARAGFAVAQARTAVQRNRARRRLRAALLPMLDDLRGADIVMSAPAAIDLMPFAQLQQDVTEAARRAVERARS